jgi:hypothetical protein
MSSREFNQDASGAKKAAERGPAFIADSRPAHVLLTMEDYLLTGATISLAEAFAQPEGADALFDPPRIGGGIFRPADLA